MSARVVVITGANRGIGAALATQFLSKPNTVVYAAVRDVAKSEANLAELKKKAASGSELRTVKLDSGVISDAAAAAQEIQKQTDKVDLVIANAGISQSAPAVSGDIAILQEQIKINTFGPIALFQAFYPLLKKSSDARFIVIGTIAGSSTLVKMGHIPFQSGFYGASKAAGAFYLAKLSEELKQANEKILVSTIHPGLVTSDMGSAALRALGIDPNNVSPDFPVETVTPEQSAEALVKVIEGLTPEQAGYLLTYKGEQMPF